MSVAVDDDVHVRATEMLAEVQVTLELVCRLTGVITMSDADESSSKVIMQKQRLYVSCVVWVLQTKR
jgi:hypothetical protein